MTNRIFIGDVVFYLALGFLTGTLAAGLGWKLAPASVVVIVAATFSVVVAKQAAVRARTVFATLFLAASAAGFFYYFLITNAHTSATNLPVGKSLSFTAIISAEPKISTKYILLQATAEQPLQGELTIFAPLKSKYQYGDEVSLEGTIEPPEETGDTPAIFPKKISLIAEHRGSWLQEKTLAFKTAILKKFDQFLPTDEAALVAGELFGGNDGMSTALKNEMSASGTSYVLSMYGYKMSLIIFLFEAALAMWVGRRTRFTLTGVAIFALVILSGGNISAIRAAIMAAAALTAKLAGRVFDPRNALMLTAAGMALFDPTLPASAAFELSFLSIAGIFYLVAPLQNFLGWAKNDSIFNWREAVIIATATLVPIIPIIAVSFGDFSLAAFPSNALISFAILPTMILGAALAVFGFIAPPVAIVIAKIDGLMLFYQFTVIKIFAAINVPLPIPVAMPIIFIGYYVALAMFIQQS
jgi:ComEC/Rec2-related protein